MFSRADQEEAQRALLKDDRLLREKEVSEMLGVAIATAGVATSGETPA
jgi:hypothetical protein